VPACKPVGYSQVEVLLIEPYYGGSHRQWVDGYQSASRHVIHVLKLPAQFWKWRMQGGAVTLSRLYAKIDFVPDLILASDMMDVSLFRALTQPDIPLALYFHENQLTYPQNSRQKHGWQYGFINYASALAADAVFFNSQYHRQNFLEELPRMLKHFGDYNELQTVDIIAEKSSVLPLGLNLRRYDRFALSSRSENSNPVILWNHRWEEDKNPDEFFDVLYRLDDEKLPFQLIITGENVRQEPVEFLQARERLEDHIIHFGYVERFEDYAQLLWQADYIVSTAHQDFFGISVTEAIYCGCTPILPNRLNYPYLIPDVYHSACLYRDGKLFHLLSHHLRGGIPVDLTALRQKAAQFDWQMMVHLYDNALESLATNFRSLLP